MHALPLPLSLLSRLHWIQYITSPLSRSIAHITISLLHQPAPHHFITIHLVSKEKGFITI
uniref:Uncharacterized protein n=1 Tax=Arundo donax TaxID=35708 RepID=A0A0A8XS70_ARUDO